MDGEGCAGFRKWRQAEKNKEKIWESTWWRELESRGETRIDQPNGLARHYQNRLSTIRCTPPPARGNEMAGGPGSLGTTKERQPIASSKDERRPLPFVALQVAEISGPPRWLQVSWWKSQVDWNWSRKRCCKICKIWEVYIIGWMEIEVVVMRSRSTGSSEDNVEDSRYSRRE